MLGVTIILSDAVTSRTMFSNERGEAWFSLLPPGSTYTVAIDNGLSTPIERRVVVEAGRFTYFTVVMGQ